MNVFSFLLSGASFATTFLAPSQWLIPTSQCLPLLIQEDNGWETKKLEAIIEGDTIIFTPLSLGEVSFKWEINCNSTTEFQLSFDFPNDSFIQGVFEQEGWHSQYIAGDLQDIFFRGSGSGRLKLFLPTTIPHFSLHIEANTSTWPLPLSSVWSSAPWKVFATSGHAVFTELRSAVTGYLPSLAETTPLACHTRGDLLAEKKQARCFLSRLEPVATKQMSKLYSVKDQSVSAFSPPELYIRPNTYQQVIISEVMWTGSYSSGINLQSDQWIELHNPTDEKLNLVGARLRGAKPIGDITFFNDLFIPPRGYIIIGRERGARTSLVRDPDKVELLTLELSGNSIQLISYQGIVLDQTPPSPWPSGKDNVTLKIRSTMQRRWPDLPGQDPTSWSDCFVESYRCREVSKPNWRSKPGENLGTPWHPNVL